MTLHHHQKLNVGNISAVTHPILTKIQRQFSWLLCQRDICPGNFCPGIICPTTLSNKIKLIKLVSGTIIDRTQLSWSYWSRQHLSRQQLSYFQTSKLFGKQILDTHMFWLKIHSGELEFLSALIFSKLESKLDKNFDWTKTFWKKKMF